MVRELCKSFEEITLFSFIYSEPEGIDSIAIFVNGTAILSSDQSPLYVKNKLNIIEETLGRDRSDPRRSTKDRAADLDILCSSDNFDINHFFKEAKSYITDSVLGKGDTPNLQQFGLPPIKGPTTVNLDPSSGDIVIVNDSDNRFINWQKTTFTL